VSYVQQQQNPGGQPSKSAQISKEIESLFLKLFGAYQANVELLLGQTFEDVEKDGKNVFDLITLMQDTKNKLHLVHRLAR